MLGSLKINKSLFNIVYGKLKYIKNEHSPEITERNFF